MGNAGCKRREIVFKIPSISPNFLMENAGHIGREVVFKIPSISHISFWEILVAKGGR